MCDSGLNPLVTKEMIGTMDKTWIWEWDDSNASILIFLFWWLYYSYVEECSCLWEIQIVIMGNDAGNLLSKIQENQVTCTVFVAFL